MPIAKAHLRGKRPHWIPVVVGLITKSDEVLLGVRPEGSHLSHLWEFPGGKIELGETAEQALARELREELGIEAEIDKLLLVSTHQYGETAILLIFFRVQVWRGEPKPLHHLELKWVKKDEIAKLHLPEANRRVLAELIKQLDHAGLPL